GIKAEGKPNAEGQQHRQHHYGPEIGGDDAEFSREVVEPSYRSREVEGHCVEPEVLADQLGPDQEHERHREKELDIKKLVEGEGPERGSISSRASPELVGKALEKEQQRSQQARFLLEKAPEHEKPGKDQGWQAGADDHQPDPA